MCRGFYIDSNCCRKQLALPAHLVCFATEDGIVSPGFHLLSGGGEHGMTGPTCWGCFGFAYFCLKVHEFYNAKVFARRTGTQLPLQMAACCSPLYLCVESSKKCRLMVCTITGLPLDGLSRGTGEYSLSFLLPFTQHTFWVNYKRGFCSKSLKTQQNPFHFATGELMAKN